MPIYSGCRDTLKYEHLDKRVIFGCPVCVNYNSWDTSLIKTLSFVPEVSGLERFHCRYFQCVIFSVCGDDMKAQVASHIVFRSPRHLPPEVIMSSLQSPSVLSPKVPLPPSLPPSLSRSPHLPCIPPVCSAGFFTFLFCMFRLMFGLLG